MSLSAAVLEYAPWSYSMAHTALTCSLSFYKKHKLKEVPVSAERIETAVGTAVHSILEQVAGGVTTGDAFRNVLNSEELLYEVKMEAQLFREAVSDFEKRFRRYRVEHNVKDTGVWVERKLAVTADFEPCDWKDKHAAFRGKSDLIIITGSNNAAVIDHKTGAQKPLDLHLPQLNSYAVLVDACAPSPLKNVRGSIHFVGGSPNINGTRFIWGPEYSSAVVKTKLRADLWELLEKAAAAVQTPRPTKCWLCRFCDYSATCDSGVTA